MWSATWRSHSSKQGASPIQVPSPQVRGRGLALPVPSPGPQGQAPGGGLPAVGKVGHALPAARMHSGRRSTPLSCATRPRRCCCSGGSTPASRHRARASRHWCGDPAPPDDQTRPIAFSSCTRGRSVFPRGEDAFSKKAPRCRGPRRPRPFVFSPCMLTSPHTHTNLYLQSTVGITPRAPQRLNTWMSSSTEAIAARIIEKHFFDLVAPPGIPLC